MTEKKTISDSQASQVEVDALIAQRLEWRRKERELLDRADEASELVESIRRDAGVRALDGADPAEIARSIAEAQAAAAVSLLAAAEACARAEQCWLDEGIALARAKQAEAIAQRKVAEQIREQAAVLLEQLAEVEGCRYEPGRNYATDGVSSSMGTPRSMQLDAQAWQLDVAAEQLKERKIPAAGAVKVHDVDELVSAVEQFVDTHGAVKVPSRTDLRLWAAKVAAPIVAELEQGITAGLIRPGEIDVDEVYVKGQTIRRSLSAAGKRLAVEVNWRDGLIDAGRSRAWLAAELTLVELDEHARRMREADREGRPQVDLIGRPLPPDGPRPYDPMGRAPRANEVA